MFYHLAKFLILSPSCHGYIQLFINIILQILAACESPNDQNYGTPYLFYISFYPQTNKKKVYLTES